MDFEISHRGVQIKEIVSKLKLYAFSKTVKQTVTLYTSHILIIVLGMAISSLNTRILGPNDYGVLAFFAVVTGFSVLFFRFGFFSAGGLLLAQEKDKEREQELIGALVVIGVGIGLSFTLFIFISSFFVDQIFHTNINYILRIFSPLLMALPFSLLIPQIGRGTNKITNLSLFKVIPKVLYVAGLLVLINLVSVNVTMLILLNLLAAITGVATIIYSFKPSLNNFKRNFRSIWVKNKEYGIHLYWGQIASQSTYKLDAIFISYFVNTTQLGFYSLSVALTSPMVALSQSLSASLFKSFIDRKRIPKRIIYFNLIWLSASLIGLIIFGRFIVILLFTEKFLPVVPLILPLALSNFFMGLKETYNIFLSTHGKGVYKRNIAFTVAVVNLLGNIILIPIWGIWGAALATLFGQIIAFTMHVFYYRQTLAQEICGNQM